MIELIRKLTSFVRYGLDEIKAAQIIINELKSCQVTFIEEPFESSVPRIIKAELFADGVPIPCLGSSFNSGTINSISNIFSSPRTDDISVIQFYDQPALTVSRKSLPQLSSAKEIRGEVIVEPEHFTTENILVGNSLNPRNIVFAHFDSIIGLGAVDNAAAISILLEAIKIRPNLLTDSLFVFAGNEEISYSEYDNQEHTYDGHGFRVFEKNHQDILDSTSQIIVVDGIGVSSPLFSQTDLDLVFQLKDLSKYQSKTFWLQNDQEIVLQNYHSLGDDINTIKPEYLEEAVALLVSKL